MLTNQNPAKGAVGHGGGTEEDGGAVGHGGDMRCREWCGGGAEDAAWRAWREVQSAKK